MLVFMLRLHFTQDISRQQLNTAVAPEPVHSCPVWDFFNLSSRLCIDLARAFLELYLNCSQRSPYLMLYHSHSPCKSISYPLLFPPSLSFIIIPPNKSHSHPLLPSASQRTLPDIGHITNSFQNQRLMQKYYSIKIDIITTTSTNNDIIYIIF